MEPLLNSLGELWTGFLTLLPRLLLAMAVLGLALIAGRALRPPLGTILKRGGLSETQRKFFLKALSGIFGLLGIVIGLSIIGLSGLAASLLAGGGLTAVVIGFAFREIGENFLAGFILAFDRPFQIGDLIQSEEQCGIVESVEIRYLHIRTADGRDVFIPNSQILNRPLTNFTRDGLRRIDFSVGIDYADDAEAALELLRGAIGLHPQVLEEPQHRAWIKSLAERYVELELSFWVDAKAEGVLLPAIRSELMELCRHELTAAGYTFSANVSTNLDIAGMRPLAIAMSPETGPDRDSE